jgi:hypothetical protein
MLEGILLVLDVLGMLTLMRWSIAHERTGGRRQPSKTEGGSSLSGPRRDSREN